jgi:hypothetical protein
MSLRSKRHLVLDVALVRVPIDTPGVSMILGSTGRLVTARREEGFITAWPRCSID